MKEWVRIVSSIQLAVLYCVAVVFYSSSSGALNSSFVNDQSNNAGHCFLFASPDIFAAEAQAISVIKEFEKLPFSAQKNYLNRFVTCVRTAELHLVSIFTRYIYHSHNEVERLLQTDIIFPFQYFW
jgi:hypothetical protein